MRPLLTTLASVALLAPAAASACGGFFCSQTPIDQSGERVLFGVKDGRVTTHVQIFYQGEAEQFAWVLPVPAIPDRIDVGTDTLFTQLENTTRPRFNIDWTSNGNCWFYGNQSVDDDAGFGASPTAESGRNGGVEVLQEAQVGPYDFAVIKGKTKDSGDEVFQWLADNGYDQPAESKNLVDTYVAEDHVFVAVKLQNDSDVGDIQPLVLEYPMTGGCVPLRLTSIAATEDMDVWVYMLGAHRAVPTNYMHVEPNPKAFNWISGVNNYAEVARDAVDQASGRAFLTEYAGDTNDLRGVLWRPGQYDTAVLLEETTPWGFVTRMLNLGYPRTAQMQNLIRKHIPKPASLDDVDDRSFYNNLEDYQSQLADLAFDPAAFVADIEGKVLAPLMEANQLFEQFRYLTRLYTIISPAEMTRDPIFEYNADLPTVSNVHRAVSRPYCDEEGQVERVIITLTDGAQLEYLGPFDFSSEPTPLSGGAADAAVAVERMYTSGPPEAVLPDQVAAVDEALDSVTLSLSSEATGATAGVTPERSSGGVRNPSAGCTVSESGSPWGPVTALIGALALVLTFRRRAAVLSTR